MTQISLSMTHIGSNIRSNLYKLLSLGFRYPTAEVFKTFQNGEFLIKLWGSISLLPHLKPMISELIEVSRRTLYDMECLTFTDFEIKLVQTFDICDSKSLCASHYEKPYREESRAYITSETNEFHKYYGLFINKYMDNHELLDHLCAELEFLSFLTSKEAQARKNEDCELLNDYIKAQKDFLECHLIQWVPKFCDSLQKASILPFYLLIARITSSFITYELELLTSILEDIGANRTEEIEFASL